MSVKVVFRPTKAAYIFVFHGIYNSELPRQRLFKAIRRIWPKATALYQLRMLTPENKVGVHCLYQGVDFFALIGGATAVKPIKDSYFWYELIIDGAPIPIPDGVTLRFIAN